MLLHKVSVAGALLLGIAFVGGCSSLEIKYKPTTPAGAATRVSVGLRVNDVRPLEKGRETGRRVGQVRGAVGIPQGVDDKNPNVAPQTVGDATSDALRRSGVGVQNGGAKTLVVTIKEYWMDGYMGYAAKILVVYELMDASGRAVWTAEVKGGAGGNSMFKSPHTLALNLYTRALTELSTNAGQQFASPAFQQALAM
ncbi:MAG: hypothetical protein ABUL77_01755 [Bacteroidota bacterium]